MLELITVAQAKITWVLYVHLGLGGGAGSTERPIGPQGCLLLLYKERECVSTENC